MIKAPLAFSQPTFIPRRTLIGVTIHITSVRFSFAFFGVNERFYGDVSTMRRVQHQVVVLPLLPDHGLYLGCQPPRRRALPVLEIVFL